MGDKASTGRFSLELGKQHVETFQSVRGLDMGEQRPSDGGGEITVTRALDTSRAFTDWVKKTLVDAKSDEARQSVTIVEHDGGSKPVRRYHLANAWASSWDTGGFDATSSSPATETVTIAYEAVTVE